jgi:hypothetical protein
MTLALGSEDRRVTASFSSKRIRIVFSFFEGIPYIQKYLEHLQLRIPKIFGRAGYFFGPDRIFQIPLSPCTFQYAIPRLEPVLALQGTLRTRRTEREARRGWRAQRFINTRTMLNRRLPCDGIIIDAQRRCSSPGEPPE